MHNAYAWYTPKNSAFKPTIYNPAIKMLSSDIFIESSKKSIKTEIKNLIKYKHLKWLFQNLSPCELKGFILPAISLNKINLNENISIL